MVARLICRIFHRGFHFKLEHKGRIHVECDQCGRMWSAPLNV